MPLLRVVAPGLFTTVQDAGRIGLRAIGVPTSGVLDAPARALANALVGNEDTAAILECLSVGPTLDVVDGPVRLALVGEGCAATVERGDGSSQPLPTWQSVTLTPGDRLRLGALAGTFCASLAVEGGIDVPVVLASRSTYVRGGFGGLGGRALMAGDLIPIGATARAGAERRLPPAADPGSDAAAPIRVVLGPQDDAFTAAGIAAFLESPYAITAHADRMGFRLEGARIAHSRGPDIVSDGAVAGSIQVPGSGQPIVLLADGQSVGGYTKIATVISADLPRLVRHKPGQRVRFAAVTQPVAEELAREAAATLRRTIEAIEEVRDGLDLQALYDRNLVSGVTAAT